MDCDDGNNFQSQHFQLGSEDNNKFPPGLQFALPRFDLDEHIQVDLRFDGLTEAQVLLGIEGREDNHWIEDFSQGSSGIEFSSGAAESRSISMRNNVWSEATSSESVEMLLKSVGEDDIVAEQTIREESEGSDVLDGLNNQMDHNSSHADLFPAKMEDIIYTDPTVPPDKAVKNSSVSCEGTTTDLTLFESTPQTRQDEKSAYENLIDLGGSPIQGDSYANISSAEEYNLHTNASMGNSTQLDHAPDLCGAAATSENTSVQGMEADPLASSVGNSVGDAGGNENQKLPKQATNGCSKVLSCGEPELNDVKQGEVQILCEHTPADGQDSGAKPVESCTSDVSPSCLVLDANSSLMVTGGKKMMLYEEADPLKANAQQGIEIIGKNDETSDHSARNTQDLSNLGIGDGKNFKIEMGEISNNDAGNCTSSLAKVSPAVDMANEKKKTVELGALNHNLDDSAAEASSQDLNFKVTGKKAADKVAESTSNNTNVSSYVTGSAIPEKVHCTHDLIDVNNVDLRRSPSLLTKSSRLPGVLSGGCQIVSGDSIVDRESRRLSSDSHGVDVEIDASASGKSASMVIHKVHTPPSEREVGPESVSSEDAVGEFTDLTCSKQLGTVNTVDVGVAKLKEDEKLSTPVTNFTNLDNTEARSEISKQSLSSVDDSASPGGQTPHCAAIVSNQSKDLQSDAVVLSHSALDKSVDAAGESESQKSIAIAATVGSNPDLGGQHGSDTSVGDESKESEALKSHEATALPTAGDMPGCLKESLPQLVTSTEKPVFQDVESGSGIANAVVANCGSPTVISCSEHLQGDRDPQENGDKYLVPKTDNICCDQADSLALVDKSTANDPKGKGVSEDDRSFTFEVVSPPDSAERETGKGWKLFNNMQPFKVPQKPGEVPSTTSVFHQTNPEHPPKSLPGSLRASDVQKTHGTKSHGKDKTRSAASSTSERGSSKQRKAAKETSGLKQTIEKENKSGGASPILIGNVSGNSAVEGMRQFAHSEVGGAKTSASQTVQTPGLPDLNSSASSVTIYHQPFTDSQQVQLRAQIFVYGSLIQGTAPDESCMISAFGDASRDGGRGMWEDVWCATVERVKNQRSPLSNLDTPMHSHSGIRGSEQLPRATPHHMKAHGSLASRTNSKGSPLAVASPVMSLSSPSWSLSPSRDGLQSGTMPRGPFLDSHQSPLPLHPYRSSHPQHHVGNNTSWFSQAASPAAWFLSQTSALEPAAKYSALPVVEAVQVTPVRDLTIQHASNTQLASNSLVATEIPATVPGGTAIETKKATSSDQKSRKRKKNSVSEERGGQINSTQSQQAPSTDVVKQLAPSVGISSPLTQCRIVDGNIVSDSSPVLSLMQNQALSSSDLDPQVATSEEMCRNLEQAKLQAEDAAAVAASAVRHSQEIWSRLSLQKSSGLVSEVEAKVASAAVAATAAVSVAKAAAAAAKVAAEAAFQAKLMADEAVSLPKIGASSQGSEICFPDTGAKLEMMTPALILKGKNKASSSSSVIVAAREAARKRVEAAAAATKRAENLDAVVKAAELAAEAVSQAGVIVAMGDPIPLSLRELIEAGPEGNWKVQQASSQQIIDANGGHGEQSKIDQPSHTREAKGPLNEGSTPFLKEHSRPPIENMPALKEPLKDSPGNEKGPGVRKGQKTSELTKTIVIAPEAEAATGAASVSVQINSNQRHEQVGADKEDVMKEGSHVEVAADVVGLRGFWFSAKVLSLKDGRAHVCYSELLQDEVRARLKECIPLKEDGDKTPKIRIAHPMTAAKFEGTRKRRRAVAGNYVWSVGDQVDALMRDGWREGVVMEKGMEDETKLTIHFPAEGDSSIVRAWNLRPSLVWKDGQWIEWSRKNTVQHYEHDTPKGKRSKVTEHAVEIDSQVDASGQDNLSKSLSQDSRKVEDSRPLMLSAKDTVFSLGKSTSDLNNSDATKFKRTGLQKEGSKVVFGVPKPGKKRKFMEVSKNLILDQTSKANQGMDPTKVAKYLIPQGHRGWKNAPKVDFKGKQITDSKSKVVKSGKAQSVQNKTKSEKNGSSVPLSSAVSEDTGPDLSTGAKVSSISHEVDSSFANGLKGAENSVIISSLDPVLDLPSSRNKPCPANEAERGSEGKHVPAAENMLRNDDRGPNLSEHPGIEPRRSNRRIQPTSRLLEGLQSSLIISKIPSVSHEKGMKTQNRSTQSSKGNIRVRE